MYEYYVAGANMEPACSVRYPLVRFANLPACSVRELSIDPLRANHNHIIHRLSAPKGIAPSLAYSILLSSKSESRFPSFLCA